MNHLLLRVGAAALILASPVAIPALAKPLSPATTGDVEAAVAYHHLELAYRAQNITSARTELQEVINCLVGPGDRRFRAAVGNTCKGQGNGAIHDFKDASIRQLLQSVVVEASYALRRSKLANTQMYALSALDYMWSVGEDFFFWISNSTLAPSRRAHHPTIKHRHGEIRVSQLKGATVMNNEGRAIGTIADMVLDTELHVVRLVGLKLKGHNRIVLAIPWSKLKLSSAVKPNSGYVSPLAANIVTAAPPYVAEVRAQPSYIDVEGDLVGRPVMSAGGESVGKVVDLVIEMKSGAVDYVLVSGNSTLGITRSPLALRWRTIADLVLERDIILTLDEKQLATAPVFMLR